MKPAKILLLVVGPLVLIAGLYLSSRGPGSVSVSGSVKVVDVTTGKVQTVRLGKPPVLPALNKDGEPVYFPVKTEPDGKVVVVDSYRSLLKEKFGGDSRLKVDVSTFVVSGG